MRHNTFGGQTPPGPNLLAAMRRPILRRGGRGRKKREGEDGKGRKGVDK